MNELLGNIGNTDVHDCGQLVQKCLKEFPDVIDPQRVGVYGGSHGGFLTGWLTGHPDYKHLFSASCLWNPALNLPFMYAASEIPDWINACCFNRDLDYKLTAEDIKIMHEKSPTSVVHNVTAPALLVIGGSDVRVPPRQAVSYGNTLKAQGVKTKMYYYPEDGHAILSNEPGTDAAMNIFIWFDEHLNPQE